MEKMINREFIKELRQQRSWSQEQLAQISGLSHRTIQRIEREGSCSLESLKSLASVFELNPSDIEIDEVKISLNKAAERGRNLGFLGAFIGLVCAYIGISFSFFNGQLTAGEAGNFYGSIGAFCGFCCAIIGWASKKFQDAT